MPFAEIIRRLRDIGESFTSKQLANHKMTHLEVHDPIGSQRREVIDKLKEEAAGVPPTLAAPYFVLIQWMEQSPEENIKAETAIKAAEAITKITGLRTKQQFLLAFIQHRFQGQPLTGPAAAMLPARTDEPVRGELERLPLEAEVLGD